jgi:hypothetical protein
VNIPLECGPARRFVYGVSSQRNIGPAERGARAGAVAAAAVTGAMLGFGLRGGIAARPFNAAAALLIGNRARGVWGFVAGVSLLGELVVIVSCVTVGALCATLLQLAPRERRARHPKLFAFCLALAAAVITLLILVARAPDFVGANPTGALSITQGAVLSVIVSVAYASGMGIAR